MKLVSTLNSTTGSRRRQKKVVHTGASFNFRMEINHQKKQFYVIEQPNPRCSGATNASRLVGDENTIGT